MGSSISYTGKGKMPGAGEMNQGAGPGKPAMRTKTDTSVMPMRKTPAPKAPGMKTEREGE